MKTLVAFMLMVSSACAASVWLKWDATDNQSALRGKVLAKMSDYSGTSRPYRTRGIVMGNQTSMTMSNVSSGKFCIYVVYSTTDYGVSRKSNYVHGFIPLKAPHINRVTTVTSPLVIRGEE
jgi:hypothetical protein